MINLPIVKSVVLSICLLITTITFAQKNKKKSEKKNFLDGKNYNVQFTEKKASGLGKPLPGEIIFKAGQVQCDLMEEKLTAPSMPFKITLDTIYLADEDSVRKVSFIADYTEDKVGYKWEATITDYAIEGTFIQTRSGIEKKRFEFEGEEKANPKKKK